MATWALVGTIDIFHGGFSNFEHKYADTATLQKDNQQRLQMSSGLGYMAVAIAVAILLNIFAMMAVFVFKNRLKVIGTVLIVVGVISLISIGFFGVVSFGMLLAARIVAFRYKNKEVVSSSAR
jgi:glucan phosphoethanolaminetransferase (alkaline phosphatase superfamily)